MGALRLYGRGWARICDYSGTATLSEFWWFTVINGIVYVGAQTGAVLSITAWGRSMHMREEGVLTEEVLPALQLALYMALAVLAITLVFVAPSTSLLVRRVRDATASNMAAFGFVLVAYVGLIAVLFSLVTFLDSSNPLGFLLLAALAFLVVLVFCVLPSHEPETMGALRLYRSGWARTCKFSGTSTRREFWTFTLIHVVVYVVAYLGASQLVGVAYSRTSEPEDVTADFGPFLGAILGMTLLTAVLVVPWTSLLVRRVRDATASSIAAFGLAAVAYVGLAAGSLSSVASLDSSDPLAPVFLLLAVLAFLTVAVVSALPSRER